jgi:predicted DNA-binding transcriptional regulator AlpA
MNGKPDRLLSAKEVCAIWGIRQWTLHRQLKAGTARVKPCGYVGKRLRWRESEVDHDIRTSSVANDFRRFILRS